MGGRHVTEIVCVLAQVLPTSPQLCWLIYVAYDGLGQGFLSYSILNKEGLVHPYLVPKHFTGRMHSSGNSLQLTCPKSRSVFPLLAVFSIRHGFMLSPAMPSAGYSGLTPVPTWTTALALSCRKERTVLHKALPATD